MERNYKKGFTLIELLVVIAIIGILSAVVLASLNSARNKGADAAIKSNLGNLRSQSELFYNEQSPNSYTGVCAITGTNTIGTGVEAAAKVAGTTYTVGTAAAGAGCVISGTGDAWSAWTQLKSPKTAGNVWCVDSTGFSGETGAADLTQTVCGAGV